MPPDLISLDNPVMLFLAALVLLCAGGLLASFLLGRKANLAELWCTVRQQVRRLSWYYLLAIGLLTYPYQLLLLLRWDVAGLPLADQAQARAQAYAKLVDPLLFYSKVSISVGVFCLINLLAWASLRVIPVLVDWATGFYREEPRADFPQRPGFKGTFLRELTDAQRMAVYLAVWGLEMLAAWGSVEAGFRIQ